MAEPLIVLCPGQGAQAVGMGRAWAENHPEARAVFDEADEVLGDRLGEPLSRLCFEGPSETLNRTDVSQPAIYVTSVACWRALAKQLESKEPPLAVTAGLSLGEYTALHVAGALEFRAGLELVALRGRAMQDAAEASESGMVALIGCDENQAAEVCDSARGKEVLVCANFNAPGQVVLSGHAIACERAAGAAKEMGLRAALLPVAGAFHSPLMAPAAERLRAALDQTSFGDARCPVMSNVTALPHEAGQDGTIEEQIRRRLVEQLTYPVRWAECFSYLSRLYAEDAGGLHELAPGKTLMGLARRIDRECKVTTHDTP
jgi:[acyl-carrier-protein] S-malonyltransferase